MSQFAPLEDDALLRSLALWHAVVHRLRADAAVLLAAWLLLLSATTLLTAGTLYADAVALGGLRSALLASPLADRSISVTTSARPSDAASVDASIRGELERVVAAGGGGTVGRFANSGSFGLQGDTNASRVTLLSARPDIEAHATLKAGRWAQAATAPREATLSSSAASALGLHAGDHVTLLDRLHAGVTVQLAVVGVWRADPTDPYWAASELDLRGQSAEGTFTTVGPFVVPEADLLGGEAGETLTFEWHAVPAIERLTPETIEPMRVAAAALQSRIQAALPLGMTPQIRTDLPAILAAVDRSVLVSRSGVIVLVLEFAVVAAYAIVLVAGMLTDRRRAETALIRSRGASARHVGGMAALEAVLLAGTAALVAPWVSLAVVRFLGANGPLATSGAGAAVELGPGSIGADVLAALAGVLAMTIPALGGVPNLAGVRAALARQTGRTLGQRLGLDLALVAVAAIALWQLRLYGAPITRNARGALGVDPLLVAAPGIGLLAGALLATRIVPRLAELAEPILERGRGLVGSIGGRAVARRPLRYTRSALLLMLAAALGTFATAHAATWAHSQTDQAAYQAGSEVRVVSSRSGPVDSLALGPAYRSIPGVDAAMPVDRLTVDSGRSVRGAPMLAIDGIAAPAIVGKGAAPDALGRLPSLAATRPSVIGPDIPTGTARLAFVIDTRLTGAFAFGDCPPDDPFCIFDLTTDHGIKLAAIAEDADGRLYRFDGDRAVLDGDNQRVEVRLAQASTSGRPSPPPAGRLRLRGLELTVAPEEPIGVTGTITIRAFETTTTADGEQWSTSASLPTDGLGWTWQGAGHDWGPYSPSADAPTQVTLADDEQDVSPASAFGGTIQLRASWLAPATSVPAIVSEQFLTLTAAHVGETVATNVQGTPISLRIDGVIDEFPTLDPAKPFVLADGPSLAAARYAAGGIADSPGEWWLATDAARDAEIEAAVVAGPDPKATVVTRVALERELSQDPTELGVIGLLGLGSLAAMVFAAIGFIVSATVSTSERVGELSLLRALGLSAGQVSAWLTLEHAFLLVVGLGFGVGLGALLAWLVLPFSTFTRTGEPALPTPAVVVPLDGLLPIGGLALVILVATTLVLRRQLLRVRISDVLRAAGE